MENDWLRKALASGKLKLTAALLSALGVPAFNSCGVYYPPPALYMPGPTGKLSGRVTSAETAAPIAGIQVTASRADTPDAIEGSAVTDSDGSYAVSIYPVADDIVISAEDPDGAANGGDFETARKTIAGQTLQADEDNALSVDFSLTPKE